MPYFLILSRWSPLLAIRVGYNFYITIHIYVLESTIRIPLPLHLLPAIQTNRLKLVDKDGNFTYSTIRTLNNSGSFEAAIFPNPVSDVLSLTIFSENKISLQLQVIDLAGKVLLTKQITAEANTVVKPIDVSLLKSGQYFVKITSGGTEQWVLKFEKL